MWVLNRFQKKLSQLMLSLILYSTTLLYLKQVPTKSPVQQTV